MQSVVKPKPIVTHLYAFSRASRQLHVTRVLIGSLCFLCIGCYWLLVISLVLIYDTQLKTTLIAELQ